VQHLYFYSDVDEESVLALRREVLQACQGRKDGAGVSSSTRPGSMHSENWLLSLVNQVHVPLCVMVAPYRVGTHAPPRSCWRSRSRSSGLGCCTRGSTYGALNG
jgi:hypothetical protein